MFEALQKSPIMSRKQKGGVVRRPSEEGFINAKQGFRMRALPDPFKNFITFESLLHLCIIWLGGVEVARKMRIEKNT